MAFAKVVFNIFDNMGFMCVSFLSSNTINLKLEKVLSPTKKNGENEGKLIFVN